MKVHSQGTVLPSIVALACLSFLLGSLSSELLLDFVGDNNLQHATYCLLFRKLFDAPGLIRTFIPISICGISQIHLFRKLKTRSAQSIQSRSICLLVVLGGVLMIVSVSTCWMGCSDSFPVASWPVRQDVITVVHALMAVVLVSGMIYQYQILLHVVSSH
jgi:hypothetical protein